MALSLLPYTWKALAAPWDVVMAMKPFPNACLPAVLAGIRGAHFVVDVDDVDYAYRENALSRAIRILQKPFPAKADLVTVHNDPLVDHVLSEFHVERNRIYRLDQGVDLRIFTPSSTTSEPLKAWYRNRGIQEANPVLFYTAHLNVACDIEPILRIASRTLAFRKDCHFLLAGGGPLASHCKALCQRSLPEGRWHMTGTLSPEEVASHMQRASVCLVYYSPTQANTHRTSMKLREYLAMGKPVAANAVGDLASFQSFAELARDEEGVSEAAIRLLEGQGKERSQKAMAFVRETLDWSRIGEQFKHRLEEMLHEGKEGRP